MARYTGPNGRLCRRLGTRLFLKGTRCDTSKCAFSRRETAPGMHPFGRGKPTDYGKHLKEKQKIRRTYGTLEKQFRRSFEEASRQPGNTGESLVILMERRLDNVIYRLNFGQSRDQARQLIRHGHICVNGKKVDVPSYWVRKGDVITPKTKGESAKRVKEMREFVKTRPIPKWLEAKEEPLEGRVIAMPEREDIQANFDEHMVVEFASR